MKKLRWWRILFFAISFAAGLLFCLQGAEAADRKTQFTQKLLDGYQSFAKTVDVKSMELSVNSSGDRKIIEQAMETVLNETAYLFYAGREFSVISDVQTGRILRVKLTYDERYLSGSSVNVAKIRRVRSQLDSKMSAILNKLKPGMSDVEKALILHDHLARTTVYTDSSNAPYRISEEGALLKKKANCNGYSLAYMALLERAGIEAKCVVSESMEHMWNLVKIDGAWYHVDVVWDAPLSILNKKNMYGYVCHDNFLLSDAAIREMGHRGFRASASGTKYDNMYWRRSDSSFWYQNGAYYYADNRGIYVRDRIDSGSAKRLIKGKMLCFVRQRGNKFLGISGNKIFRFDVKSRKKKAVYKPPKKTRLIQLKCGSRKMYFRYAKGRKVYTKSKKLKKSY